MRDDGEFLEAGWCEDGKVGAEPFDRGRRPATIGLGVSGLVAVAGIVVGAAAGLACGDAGSNDCPPATEGCPCVADACRGMLHCVDGICESGVGNEDGEDHDDGGDPGGPLTEGTGGDGGSGVADDGDGDGSTTFATRPDLPSGCTPESDAAFCSAHGSACGVTSGEDACGQLREVDCGACARPEQACTASHSCIPRIDCVNAALEDCCQQQAGSFTSCALSNCGFFGFDHACVEPCDDQAAAWGACVLDQCPGLDACGSPCESFCAQALDGCNPAGVTYPECVGICETNGATVEVGCGIALDCSYNGVCDSLP